MQVQALRNEEDNQRQMVADTKAATPNKLYALDLDTFMAALEDYEDREARQLQALEERQRKAGGKGKGGKKVGIFSCCTPPPPPDCELSRVGHSIRSHLSRSAVLRDLYIFGLGERGGYG